MTTSPERADARVQALAGLDHLRRTGPPDIVVFVDAWTSWGDSQFINSTSTGRYMDYLCDEVPEFVVLPIIDGNDAYLRWVGESTS